MQKILIHTEFIKLDALLKYAGLCETGGENWLRADSKGNFAPYANHWHFTATSSKQKVYRFATVQKR